MPGAAIRELNRRRSSTLSPQSLSSQYHSIFAVPAQRPTPEKVDTMANLDGLNDGIDKDFGDNGKRTSVPNAKLNNGLEMPVIGLGTSQFELKDGGKVPTAILDEVQTAVEIAIDLGYRHIDTAYLYENEGEIGKAIKNKIDQGVVKREDLFINTKLWNIHHNPKRVLQGLKKSLENLQLNYVDSFLIHTPVGFGFIDDNTRYPTDQDGKLLFEPVDHVETWRELEKAVDQGLAKSIGLSNFNQQQIQHVLDNCRIKPAILQIENHAYLMQRELFEFCKTNQIEVVGFAPLGSARRWCQQEGAPVLKDDPVVLDIAERFKISPEKILLRYLIERGRAVIPKSSQKHHLQANLELFDFALSEDDLSRLDGLDRSHRYFPFDLTRQSPEYPF